MKYLTLVFVLLLSASCASNQTPGIEYDVILNASITRVKPMKPGMAVDAVEATSANGEEMIPLAVVVFRVDTVIRGEFVKRLGGPTRYEQAREAVADKNILKILTADFKDPDTLVQKSTLSVAVEDPEQLFGIVRAPDPNQKYRIYLKHSDGAPNSYILTHSKPLK